MFKKFLLLTSMISVLLVFCSCGCGLDYRYSLDENKHNKLEIVMENEGDSAYTVYQGNKYIFNKSKNFFSVFAYQTEDDILISWNGYRYIWYIDEYYSYTNTEPLFIYEKRLELVFFREDYDYMSDTFIIDGSDSEMVWSDIFTAAHTSVNFVSQHKVSLYSKQCPRIKTTLDVAFIDNQWYISLPNSQETWIPSDGFVTLLSDNGLI